MNADKSNPDRFEVYNLLPDGKSFTIPNCKFIFKLDRFGGWKDEHGQYFNADGQPDEQPEDGELTPSEASIHSNDKFHDQYDELYAPDNFDDDQDVQDYATSQEARRLERIQKNLSILQEYPAQKMVRVAFSNIPFKMPPKSVYTAYSAKVDGIINIDFQLDQKQRRNGKGNFIMKDAKSAQNLIKLEGEKVTERQVNFTVQNVQQLALFPIKQQQMRSQWNIKQSNLPVKQFFNSSIQDKTQQQTKVEEKPKAKEEEKPQTKKEAKKIQDKKQQKPIQKPEFQLCILNFQIFPKKTDFFTWMKKWDAEKDRDIRNINKKEQNGKTIITLEIRSTILQKCNGKEFEGKKVQFTKLQGE